jgi:uncharacterized membrane protein
MAGPIEPLTEEPLAPDPSSTGLDPTLAALLAYLLVFVSGLLFLVIEKKSRFVRFHAMQSTLTFLALFVVLFVAGFVPVLGSLVDFLATVLGLALWVLLMVRALQGEWYKLPVVGDMAEERARLPG